MSVISGFVAQIWENFATSLVRLALRVGSVFVSLVITVTLILAYQQTVPKDQLATWGSFYGLLVAFGLGALAHRALRALQSQSDTLVATLRGDEQQGDTSAKASS